MVRFREPSTRVALRMMCAGILRLYVPVLGPEDELSSGYSIEESRPWESSGPNLNAFNQNSNQFTLGMVNALRQAVV